MGPVSLLLFYCFKCSHSLHTHTHTHTHRERERERERERPLPPPPLPYQDAVKRWCVVIAVVGGNGAGEFIVISVEIVQYGRVVILSERVRNFPGQAIVAQIQVGKNELAEQPCGVVTVAMTVWR